MASAQFLVDLDLTKNQLINAALQRLTSAPASPATGQVYHNTTDGFTYFYNGTTWKVLVNSTTAADSSITVGGTSANPTLIVASNGITTGKIADDAVTTAKILDGNVTSAKIASDAITNAKMADNAINTAELVDSAVTSAKINDGAVGTTKIATSAVTSVKIADDAVTTTKILDLNVTEGKLADSAVATAKLANGAVTTAKITDANITTAKLADSSVTTAKIADVNVTTGKLADVSVTTGKIADDAVTTAKILDLNVTTAKIAADAITNAKMADDSVNTAELVNLAVTTAKLNDLAVTAGKIAADAVTTAKILDANVTTAKLADDSVTNAKLADDSVNTAEIVAGAVTTVKLADGSVSTEKIIDSAVTTAKLNNGAVTTAKISDDAVDSFKLADGAVTTAKIVDTSVRTAKINDGAVTTAKLDDGAVTAVKITNSTITEAKLANTFIRADGNNAFSANQSMGGFRLTSVATPVSGTDAVNKNYVDGVVIGLDFKNSVHCASTGNIPGTYDSGPHTITATSNGSIAAQSGNLDMVAILSTGTRVLLKDQTTAAQNGIYVVSAVGDASNPYVLTRATDADEDAEVTAGMFCFVEVGSTYADTGWVLTTNDTIDLGNTALNFAQFSSAGIIEAGAGLTKTGNTIDVGAGTGIQVNANDVQIDPSWEGQNSITTVGTIGTGTWQGDVIGIAYGGTGASNAADARSNLDVPTRYAGTITGDAVETSFTVTHNMGTRDVIVQVREVSSPYTFVETLIKAATTNTVTVEFQVAPGDGTEYRVIVIG